MSSITVEQLATPLTKEQVLQTMIDILAGLGFHATSWHDGSEQRTLLEVFAQMYANLTVTIAEITKAGHNETSAGNWLTLLSRDAFDNVRNEARKTQGALILTAVAAAPGPFTIDTGPNQLVFADVLHGFTYRNITGGILNAGASLELMIEAESAGVDRNVAPDTITIMQTPLAGVSCNNPIPPGGSTWITQAGSNEEGDPALQERNRTKWATLAAVGPAAAYINFARDADSAVTRVFADDQNPRGPGTFDLYLAGDEGVVDTSVVAAVDDYIRGVTDGVVRLAPSMDLLVQSAIGRTVVISGEVYILRAFNTPAAQQAIGTAVTTYFRGLPIGGTKLSTAAPGSVVFAEILRAVLSAAPGVRNFAPLDPLGDVLLAPNEVAMPLLSPPLTFISV